MDHLIRINKFLSESGFCSRREADRLIDEKRVTINGKVPEMGTKVDPQVDIVAVNGKRINERQEEFIYLMLNKPPGIECTTNTKVRDNIVDFVNYPERIFPIGRLDKDSEGLILMTNDGDIVNKILRARNNHEKEYIVRINVPVTDKFLRGMRNGVPILDTVTQKCVVEKIDTYTFRIILTQGLNRQIRRMCEYFGAVVQSLKRIRIMNLQLDIPTGRHRLISAAEMAELNLLLGDSTKTKEGSLEKRDEFPMKKFIQKNSPSQNFKKKYSGRNRN